MKWLRKLMYSCKYACLLIEKKVQGEITFKERLQLKFHLFGCTICRLYSRQSDFIDKAVHRLYQESNHPPGAGSGFLSNTWDQPARLDENLKRELQDRIEDELNKN